MRLSNKILLASLNRGKFNEFQALFAQRIPEVELLPAELFIRNAERLALAEKGETYFENAASKARLANLAAHYPALADDSGIEVLALEGRPGVRSHRYAAPQPHLSQDQANVEKMLQEMQGKPQREARYVCELALIIEGILIHATGTLEGVLATEPRGKGGFGYDPIFIPRGKTQSFAELPAETKNSISHRALAVEDLLNQIRSRGITFARP